MFQKESRRIICDLKLLEKIIRDFCENFDGFTNEFQYDFLMDNLDNILSTSIVTIYEHYTCFFFDISEKREDFVDENFIFAIRAMPFLFAEEAVNAFFLRQELHDKLYDLYKRKNTFALSLTKMSYKELLQRPEWKQRRQEIIELNSSKCSRCGKSERLQVHHKKYKWNTYPWNYPDEELECICRDCHFEHHLLENNAGELDSEIFRMSVRDDIADMIRQKIEILQFIVANYTDKFMLLLASEGEIYEVTPRFYIIKIKHLRKRKTMSHEMIKRHISKQGFVGVSYSTDIIKINRH